MNMEESISPVTDEVLLLEHGSIRTEEGVLCETTVRIRQGAHMERLQGGQCKPTLFVFMHLKYSKAPEASQYLFSVD